VTFFTGASVCKAPFAACACNCTVEKVALGDEFEEGQPVWSLTVEDPAIQVKILRVIETRTFHPVGDTASRHFDGKLYCANS
jgi:sigma-54 interacting transcriptional regulator